MFYEMSLKTFYIFVSNLSKQKFIASPLNAQKLFLLLSMYMPVISSMIYLVAKISISDLLGSVLNFGQISRQNCMDALFRSPDKTCVKSHWHSQTKHNHSDHVDREICLHIYSTRQKVGHTYSFIGFPLFCWTMLKIYESMKQHVEHIWNYFYTHTQKHFRF